MSEYDWLKELKVGDEVAAYAGYSAEPVVGVVESVTPTLVRVLVCNTVHTFNKDRGQIRRRSNGWSGRSWIAQLTPETRAEIEGKRLRNKAMNVIDDCRWRELPTSTLEAIAKIITDEKQPKESKP